MQTCFEAKSGGVPRTPRLQDVSLSMAFS